MNIFNSLMTSSSERLRTSCPWGLMICELSNYIFRYFRQKRHLSPSAFISQQPVLQFSCTSNIKSHLCTLQGDNCRSRGIHYIYIWHVFMPYIDKVIHHTISTLQQTLYESHLIRWVPTHVAIGFLIKYYWLKNTLSDINDSWKYTYQTSAGP